jgi:hypothetical protein
VDVVAAPDLANAWTTYRDDLDGYTVDLPPGMRVLSDELRIPAITDPVPIGVFATFEYAPDGSSESLCDAGVPKGPVETMASTDVFVWLEERRRVSDAAEPSRPMSFETDERRAPWCAAADDVDEELWTSFTDADRQFYLLVVIGRDVPPPTAAHVWTTVDSLRFDRQHTTTTASDPIEAAPSLSGELADGRPYVLTLDAANGLCLTVAEVDFGCDTGGPVLPADADPATPRTAIDQTGAILVYGMLPAGAEGVVLTLPGGTTTSDRLAVQVGSLWAIPVPASAAYVSMNAMIEMSVTYVMDDGDEVPAPTLPLR